MNAPARRGIVVGMDGASMELVSNMVQWGHMPNLARLMESGGHRPMIGVFPTLTPPGWTATSTGSWPGTHEVMDFNIRKLGGRLDETVWGIDTGLSRSEYVWNTLERVGKMPILVKWEMSWPPTVTSGIQVEGTGPGVSNYHQIAGYHLFVAGRWAPRPIGGQRDPETLDPSALQDIRNADPVALQPIEDKGWVNLPTSFKPPFEVELVVRPLHRGRSEMLRGKEGTPKIYYGLIHATTGDSYDRLLICSERDGSTGVAQMAPGEWSEWWRDRFVIDGDPIEGHARAKLVALDPELGQFELFMPQIWPAEGYTEPASVAAELDEKVGNFLQNPARDALGVVDDDTYFELLDFHHDRLAEVAEYLAGSRDWDLMFVETHASDYASHFFLSQADEISGASPETIKRCRDGLARTFASIDSMIGRLMTLKDEDTVFMVVSDHGGTPNQHRAVNIDTVLEETGFLVYRDGTREVDWSRTLAANVGLVHIFINLEGREPGGIVAPEDYRSTQLDIIAALNSYVDAETGLCPFALALTRQDAEMVNLWGDLVGDVVYALRPEFDGAHGKQLPTAELGIGGQHCTFVVAGAGVRAAGALRRQVRAVDVAPTLCYLLGVPMPRDVEGGVVYEALEDPDWHLRT